ncbi:FliH/SctL family protein [Croceicoccus hydrothermalis]|uniref:FliH/SctL family protein n=1 Tax=Croceicoccus hydrothermalis TaxID=2867964 RepID=UPI001EFB33F3|nr:FliH/SctL family protein [Croceicoccus hydrothermalis]
MFKENTLNVSDTAWIDHTRATGIFAPDSRFTNTPPQPQNENDETEEEPAGPDPIERAYGDGLQKGREEAEAEFAEREAIRARLAGALTRLDADERGRFAERLRETVMLLCEAVLGEAAGDAELLKTRCDRAIAALADGEPPVLRMHPADIEMLDEEYRLSRSIIVDPAMKRGDLRAEQGGGGVVCGPADWMVAVRAAVYGT